MNQNTQLLVHARAPTSRRDDDRARSQLRAYMDLNAAQISRVSWPDAAPAAGASIDPTLYLEDTQLAYAALESQLFTSTPATSRLYISPGSRKSRVLLDGPTPVQEPLRTSVASAAISSSVSSRTKSKDAEPSQSSYLVSPFISRPSKRQRLDTDDKEMPDPHLQGNEQLTSPTNRHAIKVVEFGGAATNESDAYSAENTATNETTSELPSSYSLSQTRSDSAKQRSTPDHGASSKESQNSNSQRTRQQALEFMAYKAPGPIERDFATPSKQSTSNRGSDTPQSNSPLSASTIAALQSLSTKIDPPEPEVGYGQFETHVTKTLQRLAHNADVAKAYCPVSVTRELRSLERGYWLVDCSTWSLPTQVEFWKYLETSIQSGKLGWGIRCTRETERSTVTRPGIREDKTNSSTPGTRSASLRHAYAFGPIKVYCWGELVQHVYLLLYIASVGKVRKLGLQWLDAEGEVVVQMRTAA